MTNEDSKPQPTKNRRSFPRKIYGLLDLSSSSSLAILREERQKDASAFIPPRIPLKANASKSSSTKDTTARGSQKRSPQNDWLEDPWDTYRPLRTLDRGGIVIAACTRKAPVEMVVIKELRSALRLNELEWHSHQNLVAFLESYQLEEKQLAVMEYTVVTLTQIIAIPLALEEIHISAVCC